MSRSHSFRITKGTLIIPATAVLWLSTSHAAIAACNGTVNPLNQATTGITIECGVAIGSSPASEGNLTIAPGDTTTYKDTAVVGAGGTAPAPYNTSTYATSNTTVQFDGHGRVLTVGEGAVLSNERVINGTSGGRGRTAVVMGAATQNESASTTFATAPAAGNTILQLNSITPSASWVGQSITIGRYDAAQGDFYPGQSILITAVNPATKEVTLAEPLPAGFEGTGPSAFPVVFNVTSNYGAGTTVNGTFYNNVVNNAGTISAVIGKSEIIADTSGTASVSNTGAVKAFTSSIAGDYLIQNAATGKMLTKHDGLGNAYAIEGGGAVTSITVNNEGLIQSDRTAKVTLLTASATAGPTGKSTDLPALAAVSLGQVNAINNQEELEAFNLHNAETGVVRATGDYSAAIVTRAGEDVIVNEGLIEHLNSSGGHDKGYAIGANSNPGEIRSMSLENSGTINGDILAVNGASLRWYLLSTETGLAPNGKDDRLTIASQHGQFDSEITNSGTINGNLWYSNGEHTLANEGTITGNIDVDQRPTQTGAASGALTVLTDEDGNPTNNTLQGAQYIYRGAKSFTFENAGTFQGNVTIATAPGGTVLGLADTPDSTVTLISHVFGGGGDSADAATGPGTIATIEGTLKIADGMVNGAGGTSSIARTTTLAPVIDGTVKDGQWFKVANNLFGSDLPSIDNGGSVLVDWEAAKNASDALVIGAEVKDASEVEGISQPGAAAINALIAAGGVDADLDILGAAVESLTEEDDVVKAAAQLAPQTNYATQQAALSLIRATGQVIDNRLAVSGGTGSTMGPPLKLGGPQDGRMNLRGDDEEAAYGRPASSAMWGQALGVGINQSSREGVDGYDAKIYGALAGYDNWISTNTRLGFAVGYANTRIDDTGLTRQNSTDVDSYLVQAYGSVKGGGWYLSGQTGNAWHNYETTRVLTVPFGDVASGDHDGGQFNISAELGAPMHIARGALLTPFASLAYSHLQQDAYSEASGAGMALAIESQTTNSLVSSLGLKLEAKIAPDTLLQGRAAWLHEFEDASQTVIASFAAGGDSFTAAGPSVGRDTAALGVGLLANISTDATFQLNYDANLREDFTAHIGSARVTVGF